MESTIVSGEAFVSYTDCGEGPTVFFFPACGHSGRDWSPVIADTAPQLAGQLGRLVVEASHRAA
jgi:hypothetical protein